MEQGYLIDTNPIIDYLANKLPETANNIIDNVTVSLSVISRMELLAWPNASDNHLKILIDFINSSVVFDLSEPIIVKAIEIRKKYRIKLPDAIIAATA